MFDHNSIEYFENFDKKIRISDSESLIIKRLMDNTVMILYSDILTGTTTILAFYKDGKWTGYNPPNFNKLFYLFRRNKNLKPALIRFLTPNHHIHEIQKVEKVIVCFKKRFHITIKKTKKNINIDNINLNPLNHYLK